jgi:dipeptidyl aminopeptidase/acylaminoacyl peptidase
VAFVWDRGGVQNAYVAGAGGESAPRALTRFDAGLIDGIYWDAAGRRLMFGREGDAWQVDVDGGEPRRLWDSGAAGSGLVPSPDGTRVAFARDGDLFVRSVADGRDIRLTSTDAGESSPVWSPDGTRLAFVSVAATPRTEAPAFSGSKILYAYADRQPSDIGVVPAAGGAVTPIGPTPATEAAPRWIDAARLSLQRISGDYRTREILVADAGTGEARRLHADVDPKFWSLTYLNPEPVPSPDGRWIAFISDRDGWDHAYVVSPSGGEARQLTRGAFEVSRLAWSPDSARVAFDVNDRDAPGVRHLAVLPVAGGTMTRLTSGRGTNTEPSWSPDGRRLLYQHTDPRSPADLFAIGADGGEATRLTDSLPDGIDRQAFVEPVFVRYPSKDGKPVPAYLFAPPGLDRASRHPAIVWVHGDGVTQNYDGWHVRRDYAVYYSFHQYLVQRGYVVLAVDYRGSIGYGREWRQGHYRDLGGHDYEDVAAGVEYLKSLGYVDTARVGVWGLSYGGFMTLQALTVTPELFACGIDVAGVVDWRDWYRDPDGPWIKGRMGSPADDPDLYRRTAPIERVGRIVRPLLVLHGTADVNVPYLESVRLVDEALKAGKALEFMMYPGEFHYFHRAHVLRDAWLRVERFFDRHLRGGAGAPGTPVQPRR